MVEPGDDDRWVYRRDERIAAPRAAMTGRTSSGIPFLLPHGSLLYKAATPGAKDEADFELAQPRMDDAAREWLRGALELTQADHPWLDRL